MSKSKNNFYYEQEIVALIKWVEPAKAKKIADAHLASGNYNKIIEQVAKERKDEKELQAYARTLSARMRAGEDSQDVVSDMKNDERER